VSNRINIFELQGRKASPLVVGIDGKTVIAVVAGEAVVLL
jgi:hypothetical protein